MKMNSIVGWSEMVRASQEYKGAKSCLNIIEFPFIRRQTRLRIAPDLFQPYPGAGI